MFNLLPLYIHVYIYLEVMCFSFLVQIGASFAQTNVSLWCIDLKVHCTCMCTYPHALVITCIHDVICSMHCSETASFLW